VNANRLASPESVPGTEEVSLLRRLRIVASTQLSWDVVDEAVPFCELSEAAQAAALALLSRMIAKGVLEEEAVDD
jgi:hypothetical protein